MSEIRCEMCGSMNPVSETICRDCGYPFDPIVTPAPVTAACPACNNPVEANALFCDSCRHDLRKPAAIPSPVSKPQAASPPPAIQAVKPEPSRIVPPPPKASPVTIAPAIPPNTTPAIPAQPPPASTSSTTRLTGNEMWKFSAVEGFRVGKEYLLFKEHLSMGRCDSDAGYYPDIDLEDQDDGYISRRHAVATILQGQVFIEDLGTENGTLVNNRRIPANQPTPLAPEDVIRLGKVRLMLKIHSNKN